MSNDTTAAVIGIFLFIGMAVAVLTFKLWLFGSLAVSSVKSIAGDCGKNYPVEVYVVNGNWFCAEEENEG